MPELVVVHLVWAPLGVEPFRRFVESYLSRTAGTDHRLLLVFKEFRDDDHRVPWDALARRVDHERCHMPERALDLTAYARVARSTDAQRLFFCNSSSVLLVDDWLATMANQLDEPGVGMVSASGSWESAYSAAPLWLKPLKRRHFDPFPNPHLRTNAFMMDRNVLCSLDWPDVTDKEPAHRLESGRRSVTRQLWARDLETLVVGRDRRGYSPDDWPASRTFRSGGQANLIVADNRTREYDEAEPARRRELARLAWGDASQQD